MNKNKPLVSILLPVHNSSSFLKDCLKSLTSQSYKNIEIIAIDDKSCDNSLKILKNFKKKDKRLRIYKNVKRYGLAVTFNRLFKKAKGQFIAFSDSEDISYQRRIKNQVDFLFKNQGVVAVGTQCTFLDEKGKRGEKSNFPLFNGLIYAKPIHGISLQFETLMINRHLLPKDLFRFNNSSPLIYNDFIMKFLPFGKLANLEEKLYYHRCHPKTYITDLRRDFFALFKLWLKSVSDYKYQTPSLRSFFSPLIKSA